MADPAPASNPPTVAVKPVPLHGPSRIERDLKKAPVARPILSGS